MKHIRSTTRIVPARADESESCVSCREFKTKFVEQAVAEQKCDAKGCCDYS